ncbi:SRPBCC family protein [Prescottella subtropica]|uniref:SRPBCC family protein n=1 Tax=Prescottella subtropica TaxID=2545757 RepID=UPI0010F4C89A|nr:SRPBCC family protein [Prescottella subtropica]
MAAAGTLHTDESIVINCPLSQVFSYMTDPARATEWVSSAEEYAMVSGSPDVPGSLAAVTTKVAGVKLHATEEITAYEKNRTIGFHSTESRIPYERALDFTSDGDGATKVTYRLDAETGTGIFKFADAITQKLYAHDVRGNLRNAKTILEATNG